MGGWAKIHLLPQSSKSSDRFATHENGFFDLQLWLRYGQNVFGSFLCGDFQGLELFTLMNQIFNDFRILRVFIFIRLVFFNFWGFTYIAFGGVGRCIWGLPFRKELHVC